MKIRSLSKLPKRKVTIDDLLNSDKVTEMLDDIYQERHDIEELVIIHTSRAHSGLAMEVNGIDQSRLVGILEALKHGIFKGDFD